MFGGVNVFPLYRKIVGGEIINTPLSSSVAFKGFIMLGNDFCGEQHKVGI